jgi:hypothetical protein
LHQPKWVWSWLGKHGSAGNIAQETSYLWRVSTCIKRNERDIVTSLGKHGRERRMDTLGATNLKRAYKHHDPHTSSLAYKWVYRCVCLLP